MESKLSKKYCDIDCNVDCFGEALEDSCGVCSGGNSEHEADSDIDCYGEPPFFCSL